MARRGADFLHVTGFAAAPALVSVGNLAAVPILISTLGPTKWLPIAVGQAVGEVLRSVTTWGWNAVGQTRTASKNPEEQLTYYGLSLKPRLLMFGLVGVIMLAGVAMTQTPYWSVVALTAASGAIYGLGSAWFFVGRRDIRSLLASDALPRAAAPLVGAAATLVAPTAYTFSIFLILGSTAASAMGFRRVVRHAATLRHPFDLGDWSSALRRLRESTSDFLLTFTVALRLALPTTVGPLAGPSHGSITAYSDKLLRWANTGMVPVAQLLQTSVGRQSLSNNMPRWAGIMARIHGLGIVLAIVMFFATPFVSEFLSAGALPLTAMQSAPLAITTWALFSNTVLANGYLASLGRERTGAMLGLASLVALTLCIIPATLQWGSVGTLWSLASVELAMTITQSVMLKRRLLAR